MQMPEPGFMLQRGTRLHVARPSYYPRIHNVSANNPSGGSLMNVQRLPSDIIGLSKVMPPLSRRGFMTSSAAAATGYTLAAGPVRGDAIRTSAKGLDAGMAKIKVADGEMPAYYARPQGVRHPPIVLVCMEIFGLHEWV